jgi:uncharacterized protein
LLAEIETFSKKMHAEKDPAHDYSHIKRIITLCKKIATPETDLGLVIQAAYFHGLLDEEQNIRRFLKSLRLKDSHIERIISTVKNASSPKPQTLEEKVLHDANILDALGAVGIARGFMKGGYDRQTISETLRIGREKAIERKVFTPTAKKIAEQRKRFMKKFLKRLEEEL